MYCTKNTLDFKLLVGFASVGDASQHVIAGDEGRQREDGQQFQRLEHVEVEPESRE